MDRAAFVDHIFAVDLVPVILDHVLDSIFWRPFFACFSQKNNVAIELNLFAMESKKHGDVRCQHALVVARAATIDVSVFDDSCEGIHGPLVAFNSHHIEVSHQHQGTCLAGSFEPGHEIAASPS